MATPTRRLAALLAGITDNDQATKVTTAGINDDAVTNAQIGTDAVNADSIAANAVGTSEVADNVLSATDLAPNSVGQSELVEDYTAQSVPHIVPGILCPAVAGKLLDGTTDHSGAYGTAQSDGKSYYYTDIKGSGPIKDPRIGAHFGSQRHHLGSMQLLKEETAIHGEDVSTVDGRNWIRTVGSITTGNGVSFQNDSNGCRLELMGTSSFIEITGYFSDLNYGTFTGANRTIRYTLDGATEVTTDYGAGTVNTPITGRYTNPSSIVNLGLGATLGIHTIKLRRSGSSGNNMYDIELIAQDTQDFTATNASNILTTTGHTLTNGDQIRLTGSDLPNGLNATTTYYVVGVSGNNFQVATSSGGSAVTFSDDGSGTRTWRALNNIQIPSQNVVSYGKKFTISAAATHYDPFTTMSYGGSGTTASALGNLIDTSTSLGMDNWKAGTANYHRPWNGGRVVKWVDSSGTIKTSVTMMPPNAQNVSGTAQSAGNNGDAVTNAHQIAGTNDNTINFDTTAIANSKPLHEVAKTFYWREFGNGAGNTRIGGAWADASMLTSDNDPDTGGNQRDNIAYVMDDGLTSLGGYDLATSTVSNLSMLEMANGNYYYVTFIGTGFSIHDLTTMATNTIVPSSHVAQNLSYGTHVVKINRSGSTMSIIVDGIQVYSATNGLGYQSSKFTFYQPKLPPIPEDAVVLADYMLMADFVPQTDGDLSHISKGVRFCSSSRDGFYDGNATTLYAAPQKLMGGFQVASNQNGHTLSEAKITAFGHAFGMSFQRDSDRVNNAQVRLDGANFPYATANIWDTDTVWDDSNDDGTIDKSGAATQELYGIKNQTLGVHTFGDKTAYNPGGSNNYNDWASWQIATPIHTSHHYQPFETPFLHELVGGDRNMEQTNLVVSPDGKTWDEVTRDTSYIGNLVVSANTDTTQTWASVVVFDEWRGTNHNTVSYTHLTLPTTPYV